MIFGLWRKTIIVKKKKNLIIMSSCNIRVYISFENYFLIILSTISCITTMHLELIKLDKYIN
jgi:protein associated with RNAse G/E